MIWLDNDVMYYNAERGMKGKSLPLPFASISHRRWVARRRVAISTPITVLLPE
jgi:hypothetical protein